MNIIPITNVNQIEAESFTVWNESNSYYPLETVMEIAKAECAYVIEHKYKSKIVKTYFIPVKGHDEINHTK